MYIRGKSLFRKLLVTVSAAGMALLLTCSSSSAKGAAEALKNCGELLIPSLFPFMVMSSFLMHTIGTGSSGRVCNGIMGRVFRLPGEALPAVIMSFIGGFPVGARCVRILYDRGSITRRQAGQMMSFCVCSGPAFLITGVGTILLHNTALGVVLYLCQIISGILIGFAVGRIYSPKSNTEIRKKEFHAAKITGSSPQDISELFIRSCTDGAEAIVQLSAMVCMFGAVTAAAKQLGAGSFFCGILRFLGADLPFALSGFDILTEVTAACSQISKCGGGLWMFAFAVGFGGLCVHLQILTILGDIGINKGHFFLFRLINGALSSLMAYIYCMICCPSVSVFGENGTEIRGVSVSVRGAAALLIMSILFLVCVSKSAGVRKLKQ